MINTRRMNPEDRRKHILECAVNLALLEGYLSLNRDKVARVANVSPGLVTRYYYCSAELKRCVMEQAIIKGHLRIVAEGIIARDPHALSASDTMRADALNSLGGIA